MSLRRVSDGKVIASNVKIASSYWSRLRGLMGRPALAEGEALYLSGTNSIHMLFMRFPIDCVFLGESYADGSQPVVAIRPGLLPWRGVVWFVRGARAAVELPVETVALVGLRLEDRLVLDSR